MKHKTDVNPDFFKGTIVEGAVKKLLAKAEVRIKITAHLQLWLILFGTNSDGCTMSPSLWLSPAERGTSNREATTKPFMPSENPLSP